MRLSVSAGNRDLATRGNARLMIARDLQTFRISDDAVTFGKAFLWRYGKCVDDAPQ